MGKLKQMRRRTADAINSRVEQPKRTTPTLLVAGSVLLLGLIAASCGRPSPETSQADPNSETADSIASDSDSDSDSNGDGEMAGPSLDAGNVSGNNQAGQVVPGRAGVRIVSDGPILTPLPPTTPPTTAAPQASLYEVQPGDTLSVIAERFGISTTALADANGITDVNTIKPGQELTIPPP